MDTSIPLYVVHSKNTDPARSGSLSFYFFFSTALPTVFALVLPPASLPEC